MNTINVDYTCNPPSSGGVSAGTSYGLTVTITAPSSVTAGSSADIAFSTAALPTALISSTDLAKATGVEFSANAPVTGAGSVSTVKLGSTATISSTSTQIPATTPTDTSLAFSTAGTATIGQPATVQILPTGAAGTTFTAITCSASTTPAKSLAVTAAPASAPAPSAPSPPVYSCTFSVTGQPSISGPIPVPMSLRVTGKLTTGSTDTITWVTPSIAQGGLGGPWTGASELILQGSLPVTGAQQGSVTLYRATKDVGLTVLKVTGSLFLSQPGTTYVHLPKAVKLTVSGPGPKKGSTISVVIACTTKSPQVGLTLKVTGNPVKPPAPQASTTPVATGTGTPVGAPNTGGGRPASNLPLVAGGAALLAVGAGLAVTARRRRHSEN